MRYYFQSPPKDNKTVVRLKENQKAQTLEIFLLENQMTEDMESTILDCRSFSATELFSENFYGFIPIRNNKIMDMVNMDDYRGQIGAVETIKKAYQFDDILCYVISGDEAILNKISILGLYSFEQELKIENAGKYMNFNEILEKSVENPEKIRIDAEKRKTLVSLPANESLSGLEAQVDLLSQIVVSLVAELKSEVPEVYKKLCNETPVEEFEGVLTKVSIGTLKNAKELLAEMAKQKGRIRENQKHYFEQRQQVREELAEQGN